MTLSSGVQHRSTLERALADAARELGASWLGIVELALEGAPLTPRWLATSDGTAPDSAPGRDWFEKVATSTTTSIADASPALPSDCAFVPLAVAPALTSYPDTCLVLSPASCATNPRLAPVRDALQQLLSQERRIRLAEVVLGAIEQAADPIELSDREGRLFFVNRAWEQFTGYERTEALGATAARLFRDPESGNHDPHFYRFAMSELHAGRPWLGAITGRVNQGRHVFAEAHVAPFEAGIGAVRGHVAIRRDLSERSSRDLALISAHREFREVLTAITDGVCVLRGDLVYFTNAAFARILSRAEASLSGVRFIDLLHIDDQTHFELAHRSEVSRVRAIRADGSHRFIEISRAGAISFDGHSATILLVRDTTDYQLAQEELARAEKLAALGSLAAGVAHELNNPLAYVALNLELLRERSAEVLDAQELEALEEAIGGVSRMRDIAGELHTFSGRDLPGPPSAVEVSRAITSALNLVNNEIRQRATLRRDLEANVFALAREGQLVQVCVNLLVNAVHAIPTPSNREHVIEVTAKAVDGRVEIAISDTGVGIPDTALPHLFDPFATSKRRGEGSGLGLAICKRIIDELGGTIRVDSTLGQGTQVSIALPEARMPAGIDATPVRPRTRRPPGTVRLRILVVEDELPIARALQKLLDAHEVIRAADGNAAVALLEANQSYDCILCDLMMPGLSGAAFFGVLSERWPALARRVAIMTGGAVTPDCKEFLEGFQGPVLRKPFSLDAVQRCIAGVLSSGDSEPSARPA